MSPALAPPEPSPPHSIHLQFWMLGNNEVKVHSIQRSRHQGTRRQPQAELPSALPEAENPAPLWLGARGPGSLQAGKDPPGTARPQGAMLGACWLSAESGGGGFYRNRSTCQIPTGHHPCTPGLVVPFSRTPKPGPGERGRARAPRCLQHSPGTDGRHPTPRGSREAGPPAGGCPHPAIPFSPNGRPSAWATPASLQGTLPGGTPSGLCLRALPSRPVCEPPSGHSNREGLHLPRGHTARGVTCSRGGHALCRLT